jgi:hypothetical protein
MGLFSLPPTSQGRDNDDELRRLVEKKVLKPVDELLSSNAVSIMIACSECSQLQHAVMRKWAQQPHGVRHVLTRYGVAHRLRRYAHDPDGDKELGHLFDSLPDACGRGIRTVYLFGHWPCAYLADFKIGLQDHLQEFAKAKDALSSKLSTEYPKLDIVTGFHAHHVKPSPFDAIYSNDRHAHGNLIQKDQSAERLGLAAG